MRLLMQSFLNRAFSNPADFGYSFLSRQMDWCGIPDLFGYSNASFKINIDFCGRDQRQGAIKFADFLAGIFE